MKKQKEIIAFWVIISIGLAAFFIPAVSSDGEVYTEASVNPDVIELGESTTVTLHAVTTAPTAGGVHLVLPVDVEYVEGSASAEPIVNGQTLEWVIGTLTPPESWDVSFDVTPLSTGNHFLNVVPDSEVIYGKVTGGGCEIPSPGNSEKKANFGFVAQLKDGEPSGSLQFTDHATGMKVHSESIDTLTVLETNATFTGTAKVNGASGYTFTVSVEDNGEPGKGVDKFAISIRDSDEGITYSADATLKGGNIQIHSSSGSVSFQAVEVFVEDGNRPPVAVANVDNMTVQEYMPVMFNGSGSYDPDGYVVSYSWDFGDGSESTFPGPVHVFEDNGTYTVSLIVEDNDGKCSEPATLTITVNPPPTEPVNFSVLGGGADTNSVYIGKPVTIWVNTTGNSSVTYHVLAGDYEIGTGKAPGEGIFKEESFTWIPMSSGEHEIKVGAVVKGKSLEWTIDIVNVWLKQIKQVE